MTNTENYSVSSFIPYITPRNSGDSFWKQWFWSFLVSRSLYTLKITENSKELLLKITENSKELLFKITENSKEHYLPC